MDLFGYFTTPVSMMLGLITPYVMKLFGLVSDWSILYDAAIRNSLITVYIYISLIGTVLTIIPYFFYDLTPDKMKRISTELQERAERADAQADMQAEREPALVTGGNDDV